MSHSKWLIHTALTLASYSCILDACSFCSHSWPREGSRGYGLWVLLTALTVFTAQGKPSQRLVMLGLAQATGVSLNRMTAWKPCLFSTFFLQLSTNSGSATENSVGMPWVWHSWTWMENLKLSGRVGEKEQTSPKAALRLLMISPSNFTTP